MKTLQLLTHFDTDKQIDTRVPFKAFWILLLLAAGSWASAAGPTKAATQDQMSLVLKKKKAAAAVRTHGVQNGVHAKAMKPSSAVRAGSIKTASPPGGHAKPTAAQGLSARSQTQSKQIIATKTSSIVPGKTVVASQASVKKTPVLSKKVSSGSGMLLAQNQMAPTQSDAGQITTKTPVPEQSVSAFHMSLGMNYFLMVAKEEDQERDAYMEYSVVPAYSFSKRLSLSALITVDQQLTGEEKETLLADTIVPLGYRGYSFTDKTFLRHSLAAILPTSKAAKEVLRYQGGVRVGNGITIGLGEASTLGYTFAVQRNFHEYTVNQLGSPNIQWQLRHRADLNLALTDSLSLSYMGLYTVGYTYGNYSRFGFGSDLSAGYEITQGFSVSAGVANEGEAFKANGVDSNISVYDDQSSVYHAGIGYSF